LITIYITGAMAPKGARELRALRFFFGVFVGFGLYFYGHFEVSNRTLLAKQKGGFGCASFCYETGATAIPLAAKYWGRFGYIW